MGGRIGQLIELALQRSGRRFGIKPGGGDALVAEEPLQVGDVHAEREQAGRHSVAQQMWVDALGDAGCNGDSADDLSYALARQHVWRWPRTFLAAGEQRPSPPRANMQSKQLRQVAPDRNFPVFTSLAPADRDHAFGEADILDPELDQLGGAGTGLQQGLQHQPGMPALGIGLVEEAQLLLDSQPLDARPTLGRRMQAGTLPRRFEHRFALRVIHPLANEDGGDSGSDARDRSHEPVCSFVFGEQIHSAKYPLCARIAGRRHAGPVSSFPLRLLWKTRLPAIRKGDSMRVKILLQITDDDGTAAIAEEVAAFEKVTERPEDLGLSIAEGKALLAAVQQRTIDAQIVSWMEPHCCCKACGQRRRSKGSHRVVFLTLYGDVQIASPRLHRCPCQGTTGPATVSPLRALIPDHVAPERLYLEARWASLVPYAAAAELLADILPVASGANATTLRQHVLRVAERVETELAEEHVCFIDGCPADWARLPIPEGRIVVGLDGGYVRNWQDRKTNFEVIVGQSVPEDREARYVGLVHGYDCKPKRRLFDVLKSQGLQPNQDVTFLTDGGEEIRALTELVTPESEHVLDWFHITMRVTVLEQYARGVAHHDAAAGQRLLDSLESIKWLLWHGNQHRSRQEIEFFEDDVAGLELDYPHLGKFARAAHEFAVYITSNTDSLINYGERYRAGERISSCLAESAVNAVISKRFAKRQQMQWTKRGAHLLLQTRTRALDGTLRPLFERWYPGLANDNTAGAC